jgi:threonine dehydratase
MRQLCPDCELIGVEPAAADDTRRSFAAGHPITIEQPDTIADGLAITAPGERTFEINRHLVADVVTVTDEQLVAAMRVGAELLGRHFEPSGVAGLAAVLDDPDRWRGRRVGIILTGGNIDATRFDRLTATT